MYGFFVHQLQISDTLRGSNEPIPDSWYMGVLAFKFNAKRTVVLATHDANKAVQS